MRMQLKEIHKINLEANNKRNLERKENETHLKELLGELKYQGKDSGLRLTTFYYSKFPIPVYTNSKHLENCLICEGKLQSSSSEIIEGLNQKKHQLYECSTCGINYDLPLSKKELEEFKKNQESKKYAKKIN